MARFRVDEAGNSVPAGPIGKDQRSPPASMFSPGPVGLVSRSGTLTYEIVDSLTRAGIGQTTGVGIGGDPILGMTFIDVLPLFEADAETKVVVMVGEIGGSDEEIAAEYNAVKDRLSGAPLEQVREQIRESLKERKENTAVRAFLDDLKANATIETKLPGKDS